ncbi:MAG TPA: hypothetical protein VF817_03765 [Patescibacteria group bacterium]
MENPSSQQEEKLPEPLVANKRPTPQPISMEKMKNQGCITDGLLTEYNPKNNQFVDLINRSQCYYMHRAIETWLQPPDFNAINYVMGQIKKPDVAYGMFIAEAIDEKADYYDMDRQHKFDFSAMCRAGSENAWGAHTCKPDFGSQEYRDYVSYITHKAIDLGVQSFEFGQIYYQESDKKDYAPQIVSDIRSYAKQKGVSIVIGAQTGAITDEKYLKLFDYIEGGVGLATDGSVENGPCLSTRGSCWALLWNQQFASKANNVLLHLDWSGIPSDDLDIFARMTPELRTETLQNLYRKFTSQNMGFLMPMFGVLDEHNGGCRGPKRKFYSPDMAYTCKDENTINSILAGKNTLEQFSQSATNAGG